MWFRVQKKGAFWTDGDGAWALGWYGYDKKVVTWYPQKPATTKVSTSWSQIGGYLLWILDNPVNAIANFSDIYTVEEYNQYEMSEVPEWEFPY